MILDFLIMAAHRVVRLRGILTMLGVIIGVAAIVSLISLGQGLAEAVTSQFATLGTDRIIVSPKSAIQGPPGEGAAARLTEDDSDRVERVPGVLRVAKRLIKSGELEFNDRTRFAFVGSMPEEPEGRALVEESFRLRVIEGRTLKSGDGQKVLVGNGYTSEDIFGKPLRAGSRVLVNGRSFEVVGVLDKLGNPQFDDIVLMPEDAMRGLYGIQDEVSAVVAQASHGEDPEAVADRIARELRRFRGVKEGKEDFDVQTSGQLLGTFQNIISIVTAVLAGIALISVIVGGVGIMNTMYTAVLERTREIGVMKAIGASNESILVMFLLESGLLGVAGGVIGTVLGAGIAKLVQAVATAFIGPGLVQAQIPGWLVVSVLGFSFLAGAVSGVAPAYRASRLQPVEALREE